MYGYLALVEKIRYPQDGGHIRVHSSVVPPGLESGCRQTSLRDLSGVCFNNAADGRKDSTQMRHLPADVSDET